LHAGVHDEVVRARALAADHPAVDLDSGRKEQRRALLEPLERMRRRFPRFLAHQRATPAARHVALERLVAVEDVVQNALTLRVRPELVAVTEKTAGRDMEIDP